MLPPPVRAMPKVVAVVAAAVAVVVAARKVPRPKSAHLEFRNRRLRKLPFPPLLRKPR
jgi:hypothetical protein